MSSNYSAEKLITLSEARIMFGYTSDHLAYLCRNQFVWAQRHGRLWLTSENAVKNYQAVLTKTGQPVKFTEQPAYLKFRLRFKLPVSFPSGRFWKSLEKVISIKRPVDSVIRPVEVLLKKYRAIFSYSNPKVELPVSEMQRLGFGIALPPHNLPQAKLLDSLQPKPWHQSALVMYPIMLFLLAVATFSSPQTWQSLTLSAANTFSTLYSPVMETEQGLQNRFYAALDFSSNMILPQELRSGEYQFAIYQGDGQVVGIASAQDFFRQNTASQNQGEVSGAMIEPESGPRAEYLYFSSVQFREPVKEKAEFFPARAFQEATRYFDRVRSSIVEWRGKMIPGF